MKVLNFILILTFFFSLTGTSYAQSSGGNNPTEKLSKPAKKAWSVGASGGAAWLFSDIKYEIKGYGVNVNINKVLSNSLAIRLRAGFGNAYGLNDLPALGHMVSNNTALNGTLDKRVNYDSPVVKDVYNNYKMDYINGFVEGIYYLPFGDFRSNPQQKLKIYVFAGAGGMAFNTKMDQLDANGAMYDYTNINKLDKKDRIAALKKMLDGTYETSAEIDKNHDKQFMSRSILLSLEGGAGLNYRISSRLDIYLEGAYTYTRSDLLDGSRWQIDGALTGNNDAIGLMSLGFNYRFGKAENIYWFDNPEAMHYKVTLQNKRKIEQLSTDADGDGVADYFDKDPETPSGISVDGSGKPIDTDRDGIPDYLDKEPFSDKSAVVDSVGSALDTDGDGVPDHRDLEPNTPATVLVNFQGKTIKIPEAAKSDKTGSVTPLGFIPVVFFDFNQAVVRPDFYNAILELVEAMKHYPNDKLKIIGHTDAIGSSEFNLDLGKRRAQAVANILVGSGIDKNRLIVESKGSAQSLSVVSSNDMLKLNRRVQFEVLTGGVLQDNNIDKKEKEKIKIKPKEDQKKTGTKPKTNDPEIDNLFKSE